IVAAGRGNIGPWGHSVHAPTPAQNRILLGVEWGVDSKRIKRTVGRDSQEVITAGFLSVFNPSFVRLGAKSFGGPSARDSMFEILAHRGSGGIGRVCGGQRDGQDGDDAVFHLVSALGRTVTSGGACNSSMRTSGL